MDELLEAYTAKNPVEISLPNSSTHLNYPLLKKSSNFCDYDLLAFSHLRWDFVVQRPQHLLSRIAKERRVFFFEEPIFNSSVPKIEVHPSSSSLWRVVPHLPAITS